MGSINDLAGVLLGLDPSLEYDEQWWAETSGLNLDEDYYISVGIVGQLISGISVIGNTLENVSIGTLFIISAGTVADNTYSSDVPIPHVSIYTPSDGNYIFWE